MVDVGLLSALMLNRWLIEEDFIPGTLGSRPVHLAVGVYVAGLRSLAKPAARQRTVVTTFKINPRSLS